MLLQHMQNGESNARDWSVRQYRDGDEAAVIELFRATYRRWPASDIDVPQEEHLRWKLHSNPEAFRFQTVAEAGARIIGTRFLVGMHAKVRGDVVPICQGMDNAVLEPYQGKGVLSAMRGLNWDEFNGAFDLILTDTGSHPAVQRVNQYAGIVPLANEVELLSLRIAPDDTTRRSDIGQTIRTASALDEGIDRFCELASQPYDFIVSRTRDYLTWRYVEKRAGPFVFRTAEENGRMTGYTVLRTSGDRGYIADVLVLPERPDVVSRLLDDALRFFTSIGIQTVECCLPKHHPYRAALRDIGFAPRRVLPIGYRPMRASPETLAFLRDERAAIHLTFGDFDLV